MVDEAAVCRELIPRMHAYGLRQGLTSANAADLVQQALVVVIEALRADRLRTQDEVAAFAFGVCKNLVRDQRRGEARRGRLLDEIAPALAMEVAELRPREVALERLGKCVEGLGPRERLVVIATFFAEQTGESIAGELATSAENIRVIRHRALRTLRTCLEAA